MTGNHDYLLYITDLPDGTLIHGQPLQYVKNLDEIFDKDPKAKITVIHHCKQIADEEIQQTKDRSSEF